MISSRHRREYCTCCLNSTQHPMFFFTEHPESSSSEELLMGPAYGAEQTCKLIIEVIYLNEVLV